MLVRPLDSSGDMMPVTKADQMISGAPAEGQVIKLRLELLYGEWWEDETIGFRAPEFLIDNARAGDVDMLASYITSYVAATEGIQAVTDVTAYCDGNVMFYSCSALTDTGDETTVEVDLSGIL